MSTSSSSCTSRASATPQTSILPTSPPSTSYDDLPTPPPTPTKPSRPIHALSGSDSVKSTFKDVSAIPSLYTLPTELLLHIVSYLPTATYPSLIQTSHHLQRFFNAHASSIIATQIQTHHSNAANLLQATFSAEDSSGKLWLVPTHPSVLLAEEGMWDREGSVDTLQTLDFGPRTAMKQSLRLTQPGPQFLLFLERRGWEIDTRFAMVFQGKEIQAEERLQREEALSWALERYSIRPFLSELASFVDVNLPTKPSKIPDTKFLKTPKRPSLGSKMKIKFREAMQKTKKGFSKPTPPHKEVEKRSLLFGEVEPEVPTSPISPLTPINEKCTAREIEHATEPLPHRHPFTDSLDWYFKSSHAALMKEGRGESSAPATVYDSEETDGDDLFEVGDLYIEKGKRASFWRWKRGVEKKAKEGRKHVKYFLEGCKCWSSGSLGSDVV